MQISYRILDAAVNKVKNTDLYTGIKFVVVVVVLLLYVRGKQLRSCRDGYQVCILW